MNDHQNYSNFISELDRQIKTKDKENSSFIKCAPRCVSCCKIQRSVLPVEAAAILQKSCLDEKTKEMVIRQAKKSNECPFLVADLCSIYEERPVICRTHGLPLLYYFSKSEGYKVTHCDLNFINYEDEFSSESLLNMETINEKLRLINAELKFGEERISFTDHKFLSAIKVKNQ